MSIVEIIRQGLEHGESYELINKRLEDIGCEFKIVERKPILTLADLMNRNEKLAGQTVNFWCKEGNYDVEYNAAGYAVRAERKRG